MGLIDDIRRSAGAAIQAVSREWVAKSDDDVSFDDMRKALQSTGLADPTYDKPRAMFHDPYSITDWGGWRQRPSSVTYDTLRQLSISCTPITAIIQLRVNQLAAFSRPQQEQYDAGYRIMLRDRRDRNKSMSRVEQKKAAELERMLETTGWLLRDERPVDRDSFRTFLKKGARDALVYDQWVYEILRDRQGRPSRFIALPSETIRPAVADTEHLDTMQRRNRVSHVQVFENTVIAEFAQDDIAWNIMNPRSDIRANGFGLSPIEMVVKLVTSWLFGFDYNSKFFCVKAGTYVTTREGLRPVEALVDEEFSIWNGREWKPARGYATGRKPLVRTKLWNGLEISTSPKHLFRMIPRESEDGAVQWREQCALKQGDVVLVDATRNDAPMDYAALHMDKLYAGGRSTAADFTPTKALLDDVEFWEMLGFAMGDGYWPSGRVTWLGIFPHHTKDEALFDRFLGVCARHGICAELQQVNKHHQRVSDGEFGYPIIRIQHKAFTDWLYELGFPTSAQDRAIPAALLSTPAWCREALMRGLFSADGTTATHESGYRTPQVFSLCTPFRRDIVTCMFSVGVAVNDVGSGWERCGNIAVQDIRAFVERIGFLQDYKNEAIERSDKSADRWDTLHPGFAQALCARAKQHARWLELPEALRGQVSGVLCRDGGMSRPRAIALLRLLGEELPEALHYHHAPVDVLDVEPVEHVEMFDIEVFDDEHVFLANHMAVHNTQGSAVKGLLNIKGAVPDTQMRAFRRQWYSMITGVQNAWRTPILNSEDVQWINMQSTNREMEFSAWMDWLTKLLCAVYGVDPVEINFQFGNTGQKSSLATQNNEEKIIESKDKGLRPLFEHVADSINSHLIWELEPDFEFSFSGLDRNAAEADREARIKEVAAYKTVDEVRGELDLPAMPNGMGALILNPVWLQYSAQQQQQQPPPMGDEGVQGDQMLAQDEGGDSAKPTPAHDYDEPDDLLHHASKKLPAGDDEDDEDAGTLLHHGSILKRADEISDFVESRLRKAKRSHAVDGETQSIDIEISGS